MEIDGNNYETKENRNQIEKKLNHIIWRYTIVRMPVISTREFSTLIKLGWFNAL